MIGTVIDVSDVAMSIFVEKASYDRDIVRRMTGEVGMAGLCSLRVSA